MIDTEERVAQTTEEPLKESQLVRWNTFERVMGEGWRSTCHKHKTGRSKGTDARRKTFSSVGNQGSILVVGESRRAF